MSQKGIKKHTWTKDDKGLLRAWIEENPNAKVGRRTATPELMELLPGRTGSQIYAMWYHESHKGKVAPKQAHTLTKLPVQPYSAGDIDFSRLVNRSINQIVKSQIAIHTTRIQQLEAENERLKAENATNKEWLRKMTRIREAVQEFHV